MLCDVSGFASRLILNLSNVPLGIDVNRFRVLFAAHRGVQPWGNGGGVGVYEMFEWRGGTEEKRRRGGEEASERTYREIAFNIAIES